MIPRNRKTNNEQRYEKRWNIQKKELASSLEEELERVKRYAASALGRQTEEQAASAPPMVEADASRLQLTSVHVAVDDPEEQAASAPPMVSMEEADASRLQLTPFVHVAVDDPDSIVDVWGMGSWMMRCLSEY